jgi:hypothetical protein
MMNRRCPKDLFGNSSGAPVFRSPGFSAAIFTYPPSGIALIL